MELFAGFNKHLNINPDKAEKIAEEMLNKLTNKPNTLTDKIAFESQGCRTFPRSRKKRRHVPKSPK